MKQRSKTETANAETAPIPVGQLLRAAREARGLTLHDISKSTHQSLDMLTALETMQTKGLPLAVLRMHTRTYARFLNLSENDILTALNEEQSDGKGGTKQRPSRVKWGPQLASRHLILTSIGAVILVISIVISVWSGQVVSHARKRDIPAPPLLTVADDGQRPQVVAHKSELSIHAIRPGWIEVQGSDGTVFRSRIMSAGEVYYPRMHAGWTITVRDAGAFEWQFDGQGFGRLGNDGEPLYTVRVDAAIARGLQVLSRDTGLVDRQTDENRRR